MSTEPFASDPASREARPHRLKRGDVVHVKPGAPHPIYPDLPMGGWTGTVKRIQRHKHSERHRYWVHFPTSTTDRLHPVYADRECRDNPDGYDPWDNWLLDELLDPGEVPPETIEPPDLPAWAQQAGDRQVRKLFGLDLDDSYPSCNSDTAAVWRNFLSEHIPLPRKLRFAAECDSDFHVLVLRKVLVPEEVSPEADEEPHGLYAEISVDDEIEVMELADLILFHDDPYGTLLYDYDHWYDAVHCEDWSADEGDERPVAGEPEDFDAPEPIRAAPRVGRNDPCPCGSGKKFKKCCLRG